MTCHNCRTACQRAGKRPDGLQRFRCSQCGKTFSEHREYLFHKQIDENKALLALQLLCEGNSIRSAERLTGLHRDTILNAMVEAGQRCSALLETKIRNVPVTDVQCDEIWGFVRKKRTSRRGNEADFAYIGDAWVFVAIERHTKLVLTHLLGKRTLNSTMQFMEKVAASTSEKRYQLTTDGLRHYAYAVGMKLDERVDYAQLIKIYKQETPENQRRYSPAKLSEAIPTPVYGDPEEAFICTSHVERQNLTMRMCMRRLTRLTNAFSKKWENLQAALALHFAYYNFCRVHGTIKQTPAMKAGITDHAWSISDLLMA